MPETPRKPDPSGRVCVLAITDWGDGEPGNGSHVLARALLERLREWFDVHALVPTGAGSVPWATEVPTGVAWEDALSGLPPAALIYNFGASTFSCRVSESASRRLVGVPLVNHFQVNLGCYARHQEMETERREEVTQDQVRVARLAVRNLFPSHSELALAVETFGIPATDCYVVPNAFVPPADPAQAIGSEAFTFLAVGRFSDSVKGADLVYRAFADLDRCGDARLEVAADDDRFLGLLRDVPADRWARLGWLPRGELLARMGAADVVIVPSRYEPFGLVAVEALCAGTPVIATRVGGLQEIVHHGVNGWLCPPSEGSRGIRTAMEQAMAAGRAALADLGSRAAPVARREYSLDRVAGLIRSHLDNARTGMADRAGRASPYGSPDTANPSSAREPALAAVTAPAADAGPRGARTHEGTRSPGAG